MANRATQAFATGVRVLGGSNAPAYTLEFLTPTPKHAKGSYETVIVPYAELGRDKKCQVLFEDVPTVSRKHAAIERKGNEIFIKNLSKTNPTLVNGRPVINQFFLTSGDEIQLSLEGPKLRYNESQTGTAKMGFTKRMNLVMKQAVRPYKRALITVAAIFVLVSLAGLYFIRQLSKENEKLLVRIESSNQGAADSLAALNAQNKELESRLVSHKNEFEAALTASEAKRKEEEAKRKEAEKKGSKPASSPIVSQGEATPVSTPTVPTASAKKAGKSNEEIVEAIKQKVLAIYLSKISVEWNGNILYEKESDECMCTGFLLNDGKLVTARHCIDIHGLEASELNFIANSGGKVTYFFKAVSPDGKINIGFTNHDMVFDTSADSYEKFTYEDIPGSVKLFNPAIGVDWAYLKTKHSSGLVYDKELSSKLNAGAELICLGYSYGDLFRDTHSGFDPYFTTAKVSTSGLQSKCIIISDFGFDSGNSGGPLFYVRDDEAIAVGIVSGRYRKSKDKDANVGVVTPLVNLR